MKVRPISICFIYIPIFMLSVFGCKNTGNKVTAQAQYIFIQPAKPLSIPDDTLNSVFDGLMKKKTVTAFYRRNGFRPVWIQADQYTPLADSMVYLLRHVQYYGFQPGSYHLPELENNRSNITTRGLIRREILLTDAFLSLSQNLKSGIRNFHNEPDTVLVDLLNSALTKGKIIQTLESREPVLKGYRELKEGLRLMLDSLQDTTIDSAARQGNVRLISINLERWRSEDENIHGRYIFINIPAFNLDVIENDSVLLQSRVIVGTPEKQTPVLSSLVECFTTYPYWHVPRKIAVEEYLPIIQKNIAFISRSNFDVLDRRGNILDPDSVDWNRFNENYFPVTLRQREGPENSLGVIKFIFDNPYAVFLHDTNAKRLFNSKTRAFSHGCIRMEKAVELAHFLVTGVVGEESGYINRFLKEKSQHWVNLKNPIPIHVRYFTCEFRDSVFFRYQDIYEKDQELFQLMWGSANPDL